MSVKPRSAANRREVWRVISVRIGPAHERHEPRLMAAVAYNRRADKFDEAPCGLVHG